jgi:hypothetical protein
MVEPVFGRWGPTEVMERVLDGTWAEVVDGMGLIEPVSIAFSGTSAAITGLGSVEFTAVTSLSLNGVFTSDFDNYMILMRHLNSLGDVLNARLRAAGTDASAANYVFQFLDLNNTTISAGRVTSSTTFRFSNSDSLARNGTVNYMYGPSLAQPTAFRSVSALGANGGGIAEFAGTHSLSTAYDGLTIVANSGTFTGRVAVYGMVK